ncbi:hypothetical protein NVB27_004651, partial [Salmonella enterica]|nr:hypothetical protein [Salmonella enterica]
MFNDYRNSNLPIKDMSNANVNGSDSGNSLRYIPFALSPLVLALFFTSNIAYAATCGTGKATGAWSTACGNESVSSGMRSTAYGNASSATGLQSTAIGEKATANSDNATALGRRSSATNVDTTAAGHWANATGLNSTALGAG